MSEESAIKEERARIVAWLREKALDHGPNDLVGAISHDLFNAAAYEIEKLHHLGSPQASEAPSPTAKDE